MIYSIILNKPLNEEINIEKLGLKISPLNECEKKEILERMDELYFSPNSKRKILKFIKLDQDKEIHPGKFFEYYGKLTDEERKKCFLYSDCLKYNFKYTKQKAKKIVDNTIKISTFDNFNKFVDEENEINFINKIIKFIMYVKEKIDNKSDSFFVKKFKNYNELDIIEFSCTYFNFTNDKNWFKIVDLYKDDFITFNNFIRKLNVDRIRDLIIIIEELFASNNIRENKIISDVSILERLLIKHDNNYDIGKQFVLKVGLLLKENLKDFSDEDSNHLTYCYAIRSCIVHGDDKSITNLPKKYLKIKDEELDSAIPANTHYDKRDRAVFICNFFLDMYMKVPVQQWFYNTEKVEFLKNN